MGPTKTDYFIDLYEMIKPKRGEKITVELDGIIAEMTHEGCKITKTKMQKGQAVTAVLAATKICAEIRAELVNPAANPEIVLKDIDLLIECINDIKHWASAENPAK